MDDQLRTFLSTIYGEAAQSSPAAWRAIASVILNRVGIREWLKYKTVLAIVANTGFDAHDQRNAPYCTAWRYFQGDMPLNSRLNRLEGVVTPIYLGKEPRIPGIVMYFSPKAQEALHKLKPTLYTRVVPKWAESPLVEPVVVEGAEGDDFRFFRYREAVV